MSYIVTIRQENNQYVARDEDGSRRAYGAFTPIEKPRKIAEYLFHADEIGVVRKMRDGSIRAEILTD